jgi:hypothetical protein
METAQTVATIFGIVVALATFIQAIREYSHQGANKRAEHFLEMRRRFKENESFRTIADLIEADDVALLEIPFKAKRDFLGFFEEIALSVNSGLLRKEVAHYMFGYYAIKCWKSHNFWQDINRQSIYWSIFKRFTEEMIEVEKNFLYRRNKYIF